MSSTKSRWFIDGVDGRADMLLDITYGHSKSDLVWRNGEPRFMWFCDSESEWKRFLSFCCKFNVKANFYERQEDGSLELKFSVPTVSQTQASKLSLVKFEAPEPTLLAG